MAYSPFELFINHIILITESQSIYSIYATLTDQNIQVFLVRPTGFELSADEFARKKQDESEERANTS